MIELTLDEAIKHCEEVAEQNDKSAEYHKEWHESYYENDCRQCASDHRQLAEWLTELKELREENKVLIGECDRLIKEKGELLSKVSGGDVLRICQLEEQLEKAKQLLKLAVEGFEYIHPYTSHCNGHCNNCPFENEGLGWCRVDWKYADEALKLIGGSENENNK